MKIVENGRSIAYVEAGRPDGAAVLVWHGFPGTGRQARPFFARAKELGLRIVAVDRPGYGGTSPAPGAEARFAVDDANVVLDRLGVRTCHLLGISGGAPYARAFGHARPQRTLSLTTVGGLGSLRAGGLGGLPWRPRLALALARFLPLRPTRALVDAAFPRGIDTDGLLRRIEPKLCPADRAVLAEPDVREELVRSFDEGLAPGNEGLVLDVRAFWSLSRPELFEPACPWHLWHGELDRVVTVEMGRAGVPEPVWRKARVLEGQGHYSLPVRFARDILLPLAV